MWRAGKKREEITMLDLEPLIERGAFNEQGKLYVHFCLISKGHSV